MKFLKRIPLLLFVALLSASCYVGPPEYGPGPYYPYYSSPSVDFYFGGGGGGHGGHYGGHHGGHHGGHWRH
jgi:hypothetical protein